MNPAFVNEGGTVYTEDSLSALGDRIGVPSDTLSTTVETYNHAIDTGTCNDLLPTRSADIVVPQPIRTAPFHAIELCVGITYTMGGIAINGKSQVLGVDEQPIKGLYAAGSATGGIEGGPDAAYLGGEAHLGGVIAR